MSRTHGSFGLTRIEFEQDFRRYCDEHNFKPGYKAAEILDDTNDPRIFAGVLTVIGRFVTDSDVGDNAQAPLQIAWRGNGTSG